LCHNGLEPKVYVKKYQISVKKIKIEKQAGADRYRIDTFNC